MIRCCWEPVVCPGSREPPPPAAAYSREREDMPALRSLCRSARLLGSGTPRLVALETRMTSPAICASSTPGVRTPEFFDATSTRQQYFMRSPPHAELSAFHWLARPTVFATVTSISQASAHIHRRPAGAGDFTGKGLAFLDESARRMERAVDNWHEGIICAGATRAGLIPPSSTRCRARPVKLAPSS